MTLNRALLLDRDGILNQDGYIASVDQFVFLPAVFPLLRGAREAGYRLAIFTNQSGVARGYYTEEAYRAVTTHMLAGLRQEGITIDLVLECFEFPEGRPPYARQSFWYKPNPGMVMEAVRRLNLDPARSMALGDKIRDLHAAAQGGIKTGLWLTDETTAPEGVTIVKTHAEALRIVTAGV